MTTATTEDLIDVADLEAMFGESPPLCQVTKQGIECGAPADWTLEAHCPNCNHTRKIFVCQSCKDEMKQPGFIIVCNLCWQKQVKSRMKESWVPL